MLMFQGRLPVTAIFALLKKKINKIETITEFVMVLLAIMGIVHIFGGPFLWILTDRTVENNRNPYEKEVYSSVLLVYFF